MHELNVNSVDPDQTPHSVASDLGLYCLLVSLLFDARFKWVKHLKAFIMSSHRGEVTGQDSRYFLMSAYIYISEDILMPLHCCFNFNFYHFLGGKSMGLFFFFQNGLWHFIQSDPDETICMNATAYFIGIIIIIIIIINSSTCRRFLIQAEH